MGWEGNSKDLDNLRGMSYREGVQARWSADCQQYLLGVRNSNVCGWLQIRMLDPDTQHRPSHRRYMDDCHGETWHISTDIQILTPLVRIWRAVPLGPMTSRSNTEYQSREKRVATRLLNIKCECYFAPLSSFDEDSDQKGGKWLKVAGWTQDFGLNAWSCQRKTAGRVEKMRFSVLRGLTLSVPEAKLNVDENV